MTAHDVISNTLYIIGIIAAIITAFFYIKGVVNKSKIEQLLSTIEIYKEAIESRDTKIADLSSRITSIVKDLETIKKHYNDLKTINLRLQRELNKFKRRLPEEEIEPNEDEDLEDLPDITLKSARNTSRS